MPTPSFRPSASLSLSPLWQPKGSFPPYHPILSASSAAVLGPLWESAGRAPGKPPWSRRSAPPLPARGPALRRARTLELQPPPPQKGMIPYAPARARHPEAQSMALTRVSELTGACTCTLPQSRSGTARSARRDRADHKIKSSRLESECDGTQRERPQPKHGCYPISLPSRTLAYPCPRYEPSRA